MLTFPDLSKCEDLEAEEMARVSGGWWIFGWGGEIGDKRRQPDDIDPWSDTRYSDGRRSRDYRNRAPDLGPAD